MERPGFGPSWCLTVAIACALAGCPSETNPGGSSGSDIPTKRSSKQPVRKHPDKPNDAGTPNDAGSDAAVDAGAGTAGAGTTAADPKEPKLQEPPAKYDCTFDSDDVSGHGYWFCAAKTKREEARSLCVLLGGDFVIIDDADENDWIVDHIAGDTYIGYSDADQEGTWIWVDESTASYENWDEMQPADDDYALIEQANGHWKSTVAVALAFACEGSRLKH